MYKIRHLCNVLGYWFGQSGCYEKGQGVGHGKQDVAPSSNSLAGSLPTTYRDVGYFCENSKYFWGYGDAKLSGVG